MRSNLKGCAVYVVREQNGISLYESESKARQKWLEQVEYCRKHTSVTEFDRWTYKVWHVTDEDETHYACVEARDEFNYRDNFSLYYGLQIIN